MALEEHVLRERRSGRRSNNPYGSRSDNKLYQPTRKEDEEEKEGVTCLICNTKPAIVRFQPCMHRVTCNSCVNEWINIKNTNGRIVNCIVCREVIIKTESS